MSNLRKRWKKRLEGAIIPAVPVPFKEDGSVDWESQEKYIQHLKAQPIEGVAVWAHTGRGLFLDSKTRKKILALWRASLAKERLIVAGVGTRGDESLPEKEYLVRTAQMLQDAVDGKADLILPYAPVRFQNHPQRARKILGYYKLIASAKIPMIFFYLYEAAGGIEYSKDFLKRLLEIESVVGIKVATLDSVMTFQDIADLIKERFPDLTLVTGEDRFLPYSFQIGAKAALIGMGSVFTKIQKKMIEAWMNGKLEEFHSAARVIDSFARVIFTEPMEGYIQRLLHILARLKIISRDACFDPFGPKLSKNDLERINKTLGKLGLL
jgi:4-hydroxy-tetrahydrodipicolinate synthase